MGNLIKQWSESRVQLLWQAISAVSGFSCSPPQGSICWEYNSVAGYKHLHPLRATKEIFIKVFEAKPDTGPLGQLIY